MCDTALEESDPFLNLELDIEVGIKQELDMKDEIKQELLSILANVETVTEAMNKAILKEEDRRELLAFHLQPNLYSVLFNTPFR